MLLCATMRYKKFFGILFAFALILIGTVSVVYAQATAGEAYERGKQCYDDLKLNSNSSAVREEWERCIDIFEKVNMAFPSDADGTKALFSAARLRREMYHRFKNKSDVEAAIELYNKLVKDNPKSTLSDDALYHIAVLRHRPMGEDDRAIKAIDYLLANYPRGDMAGQAKALRVTLSKENIPKKDASPKVASADDEKLEVIQIHENGQEDAFAADVAGPFDGAFLTNVEIKDLDGSTRVELGLTKAVGYAVEFTEMGPRTGSPPVLELTLSYVKPTDALTRSPPVSSSEYLQDIKIKRRILGSGIRIVFTMKPGASYEIIPGKENISISFRRGGPPPKGLVKSTSKEASGTPFTDSKKKAADSDRPGAWREGYGGDRAIGNDGEGRGAGDFEEDGQIPQNEDGSEDISYEEVG
jgi:hypothetical protein